MIRLFELGGKTVSRAQVSDWLKKDDDPAYQPIYDVDLATFLNGFIIKRRGQKGDVVPKPEKRLNNNTIFRKIKIALSFKDEDIVEIMDLADMPVSKHEINAIFRNPTQKQYRVCKDQFLRNFLQGLQIRFRQDQQSSEPENIKSAPVRIITRPEKRD